MAQLPPPVVAPISRNKVLIFRGVMLAFLIAATTAFCWWLWSASGRLWVGLLVFGLCWWVLLFFVMGFFGAIKVSRTGRIERREKALRDPIGSLLPTRGALGLVGDRKHDYARLLALSPRPIVVIDHTLIASIDLQKVIGTLAPSGRMPEPEVLESSPRSPGGSIAAIGSLLYATQLVIRPNRGTSPWFSNCMFTLGVVMGSFALLRILCDPWLHRKLRLPRFFSAEPIIGAGWLRDGKGRVWTVDDTILLLTNCTGKVEVRTISAKRVESFYLTELIAPPKPRRGQAKARKSWRQSVSRAASDVTAGAAKSVGIEAEGAVDAEMPGPSQPLRLLLSSWTYPEPRTDLAPRD